MKGNPMERYVAIDNVCAWPNLTRMPQGTILAIIYSQPAHATWEGDCECWASEDSGLSWRLRGVPGPHEAGQNRMNCAAGLARDGSIVALVSGYDGYPAPADTVRKLPALVRRSSDLGRTWETTAELPVEQGTPFGKIVPLADGALGVSCYGGDLCDGAPGATLMRSEDDGRTWRQAAVIGGGIDETDLLALEDGRLLAAARTCGDGRLVLWTSDDDGRNWARGEALTLPGQHPAHLLRLADGRMLLTYGIRNAGMSGIGYRIGGEDGRRWSEPALLLEINRDAGPATTIFPGQAPTWDCGYPSSAQLENGMIVTAYYARSAPWHTRYHMGVARWRV